RAGNLLFVSGLTAADPQRKIVGKNDIAEQARYIHLGRLLPILQAANIGFGCGVETVDYVTTFGGYERTAEVRREVFSNAPFPAATGVLVAGLIRNDALIEIRAVAVLPNA